MVLMQSNSLAINIKCPEFSLTDSVTGNIFTQKDIMGKNGMVIMFICNHCPYVKNIIKQLIEDCHKLQTQNIGICAIMSNDYQAYPDDHPDQMIDFAKKNNMFFPYLIDETQEIAKSFDAICTPEFYGFNGKYKLKYRGRLDNLTMGTDKGTTRKAELLQAMKYISEKNDAPQNQYNSIGCSIKWKTA